MVIFITITGSTALSPSFTQLPLQQMLVEFMLTSQHVRNISLLNLQGT